MVEVERYVIGKRVLPEGPEIGWLMLHVLLQCRIKQVRLPFPGGAAGETSLWRNRGL